jgi:hypothetical protein
MRIAFGYKAGAGKTTAAEYLLKKYTGENLSFASSVYKIAEKAQNIACFPVKKDRALLQMIGTWGRTNDPDVWVNNVKDRIMESYGNIFISDVRFDNEFDMLKEMGFLLIKIERHGDSGTHISDISLDSRKETDWDHIIKNDGTLEEFQYILDNIVKDLGTDM